VSVETVVVSDEDEMRALFRKYIEENFEGLMLRDPDSLYVGKRSTGLLKVKERDDSDFEIVGVEEGRGKLSGHGIFILRTAEGKEFRAKMKGETDALRKYLEDKDTWIGRRVTVAYQGLTADGIPRFPVAIRVHETL
jgi:ATP-dependent DNA ligase